MPAPHKKPMESKFISYEHLDKIGEISTYYGFVPMKSPTITKEDIDAAKDILEGDYVDDETELHAHLPLHVEEKIAIIRTYHEQQLHAMTQPVMIYFKDPSRGSTRKGKYHRYADLEILGTSGPIAEATLIQTSRTMLIEEGYSNTSVEINSIGDRESIARFTRELTSYYRKHINTMSSACRQLLKQDPFELLASRNPDAQEINSKAPRSMDFLSETSRRHLEEVLEYLEKLSIPYVINNSLIGNRKYCTETIFTIINSDVSEKAKTQRILAVGVRYNGLAKRLAIKRDVQGVGISLIVKEGKVELRKPLAKVKRPIAAFVQLGVESKLISLEIIECLRNAKIPLHLSLAKDRLTAQVSSVEKYHTPYVLVVGKKEAVERTIIVRDNDTHAQNIIPLEDIAKHMKNLESKWHKK